MELGILVFLGVFLIVYLLGSPRVSRIRGQLVHGFYHVFYSHINWLAVYVAEFEYS